MRVLTYICPRRIIFVSHVCALQYIHASSELAIQLSYAICSTDSVVLSTVRVRDIHHMHNHHHHPFIRIPISLGFRTCRLKSKTCNNPAICHACHESNQSEEQASQFRPTRSHARNWRTLIRHPPHPPKHTPTNPKHAQPTTITHTHYLRPSSPVPRSAALQSAPALRHRLGNDAVAHRRPAVAVPLGAPVQFGQLQPVGGFVQPPQPRGRHQHRYR